MSNKKHMTRLPSAVVFSVGQLCAVRFSAAECRGKRSLSKVIVTSRIEYRAPARAGRQAQLWGRSARPGHVGQRDCLAGVIDHVRNQAIRAEVGPVGHRTRARAAASRSCQPGRPSSAGLASAVPLRTAAIAS